MRVHEIAKQKGVSSKDLLDILIGGGYEATSHMAILSDKAILYINEKLKVQSPSPVKTAPSKNIAAVNTSVKTQVKATYSRPKRGGRFRNSRQRRFNNNRTSVPEIITEMRVVGDMALFEAAEAMGKSSGELILALMKKGLVCNRNHVLEKDVIEVLAESFNITVIQDDTSSAQKNVMTSSKDGSQRWPVVVIMGHVDHGKTSLLDYIRKSNVASREQGGITQHLGAYEVEAAHGKLIFLDTPGHAAFSHMRRRGASVTDIAVLVVAADDGVMPQTIEAIKYAKEAKVAIVVAITKIDKPGVEGGLEKIKRQLSQHDLITEEWGGDVLCVSVSSKTGEGVDNLLDMLVLQSEMLELRANTDVPAKAFVLESNLEKGHGPVATTICIDGTLKQGDYFVCGNTKGKIKLLINSYGKHVKQVGPSIPVKIIGFNELAVSGEVLQVVSFDEYTGKRPIRVVSQAQISAGKDPVDFINLVIKTDVYGTSEAIIDFIKKLSEKNEKSFNIVSSGVGNVSEGDISLASNTNAIIVAMNVGIEKNASLLAKESSVKLLEHSIIYKLGEELEKILIERETPKIIEKKVAESEIIKVFNIKGVGIIAGSRVKSGAFVRNSIAVCIRDGLEVGRSKVSSLERKNKPVKEVGVGTEFAFITKDFQGWQLGDLVHCIIKVEEKR